MLPNEPAMMDLMLDQSREPILVVDAHSARILLSNGAAADRYGCERAVLRDCSLFGLAPPQDEPVLREHWRRSPPLLHDYGQWRQRRPDGSTFSVGIIGDSLAFRGGAARILLLRPGRAGAHAAASARPGVQTAGERLRPTPRALLKVLSEMEAIRVCLAQAAPGRLPTLVRLRECLERGADECPGGQSGAGPARSATGTALPIGGQEAWDVLDLSALAERVVAQLRCDYAGRAVEVYVAPGLRALGERRLVELLLRELLEHSWQQTFGAAAAGIRVDCTRIGDEQVFYVRDNSPNFDAAETGALFEGHARMSVRAGRREAHIGLLTARHVAQSHGGRLWVDGFAGVGATWYFTLPAEAPGLSARASPRQTSRLRT